MGIWKQFWPVSGLLLLALDYSSAKLLWNAVINVLGYFIYLGNSVITSIPSPITTLIISRLKPGTTYKLYISIVGEGGNISSYSNIITINTKLLPGRQTITNYYSSPGTYFIIYTIKILVPYAFIHLYIWDLVGCKFNTNPG